VKKPITSNIKEFETRIKKALTKGPQVSKTAYISPKSSLTGLVVMGELSSTWPMASLRGDIAPVYVGEGSNVQDNAVLHVADDLPCHIGKWCTIGHSAIVHACRVGDECLIGMGAIILDGSEIGAQTIIGAGALVTQKTIIPPGSLVFGSPAKVIRPLTKSERLSIRGWAERYVSLAKIYLKHH
jgi:carbonic anhydrase/acetyltransferase-like protein (isoleucine patch superfamily)